MAKAVVLVVLVIGVLSFIVDIYRLCNSSKSNTNAVTAVTRLTPQVWEHFTKLSAQSFIDASTLDKDTYGYIMLLLSYNKIIGASTDDIIFALEQFAIKHPDMKAHASSAIGNVQGIIPGGEVLVYVRHNGELNGE